MLAISCLCGTVLEAADDEALLGVLRAHVSAAHPGVATEVQLRNLIEAQHRLAPRRPRVERIGAVEVRPIGPTLLRDWLRFFDHEAFADNPIWASCYCAFNHLPITQEAWANRTAAENRDEMSERIACGAQRGYLAYVDGQPAGWLNAAPRSELPHLSRLPVFAIDDPARVGTAACFVIAPPYRKHGLARRLLDAACADFADQGLAFAEGFPAKDPQSDGQAYHGPPALYRAAGFDLVEERGPYLHMRKALRPT
ncbi:MAG TPA: GNAT family N-acetyltransferase [Dehalococcoidia bacterium]|jgi:GNAT superfamily N-acetyltransferase